MSLLGGPQNPPRPPDSRAGDPAVEAAVRAMLQKGGQPQKPQAVVTVTPPYEITPQDNNVLIVHLEPNPGARQDTQDVEEFYVEGAHVLSSGWVIALGVPFVKGALETRADHGLYHLPVRSELQVIAVPPHEIQYIGFVEREDWMEIGPDKTEEFVAWILPQLSPDQDPTELYKKFSSSSTTADAGTADGAEPEED